MQLDLFGAEAVPSVQEGGPPNITHHLLNIKFGPVTKLEAVNDNAFMSTPELSPGWITQDAYESMLQSGRIAQIVEEVSFDKIASVSGLDGRRSAMKQHLVPIVLDRLNGMNVPQLAAKYNMTAQGIQNALNRPSVRKFAAKLLGEYARSLGDVRERIMHHATEAVDVVVDLMRTSPKDETRQKSAFALLRMAGYDSNVTTAVTINEQPLDESIVSNTNKLLLALEESSKARQRGHNKYVETGTVVAEEEVEVVQPPVGLKKTASA